MKKSFLFTLLSIVTFLTYVSCSDDDNSSPIEQVPVQKSKLSGLIEKGPFVNGSKVSIYELNASLSQTGNSFSATTDGEGFFELNGSIEFASSYVQLSVDGFYFNEITGKQSSSQITLEAIADIKDKNSVNANLITHLEFKRVLYLVNKDKKKFDEAKKQAENELLNCFLIKDKTITPETVSIKDNNVQANMLIAISSILLNAVVDEDPMEMDAKFTILINNFRDDFEKDGQINDSMKETIKDASYRLNYKKVKENIEGKYEELGKNVTVGNFHYFIDGDGDGVLSDEDYEIIPDDFITPDDYFQTEEDYKAIMASILQNVSDAAKQTYLFDALFTQSVSYNSGNYSLDAIYNHQIDAGNTLIYNFYKAFYQAINKANLVIEKGGKKEEFLKYKYACMVYRAYCYLTMVELWGDMPFVTKSNVDDYFPSRTNKNEIISALITDLAEVQNALPDEGDYMICSKYLATALLANASMQQKDYSSVLTHTLEIINSGKYSLCTNLNDAFNPSNKETLFSFLANEEDNPDFNELIRKGQETPMIRYAGILLTAAEASLQQNSLSDAIQYVNQVRGRNNRTLLSGSATKNDIQSAALEEWEKDLAKEGCYFYSLKRFGLAESVLQIPEYMTLLPIPSWEISLNPYMTQNPGY